MSSFILAVAHKTNSGGVSWKDVADTFQSLMAGLAILVGGAVTYVKFFKDRVYRPRVDIAVDGGHATIGNEAYLMCRLTMRNAGSTKLSIVHDEDCPTRLLIFKADRARQHHAVPWGDECDGQVEAFARHQWIESGERISDDLVFHVPGDDRTLYRLRFQLVIENPQPAVSRRYRAWQKKIADSRTDRDKTLTDEQKSQKKAEREAKNDHESILNINAVTTVWPTELWPVSTTEGANGARDQEGNQGDTKAEEGV